MLVSGAELALSIIYLCLVGSAGSFLELRRHQTRDKGSHHQDQREGYQSESI